MTPAIVWFRQDLRLGDNPALAAALADGRPVIPLYIHAPHEAGRWPHGAASMWWLHHSLARLAESLRARGSRLIVRSGPSERIMEELLRASGAEVVHCGRLYEPALARRDRRVERAIRRLGARLFVHEGNLFGEPAALRNKAGGVYRVFTPFYRASLAQGLDTRTLPAPRRLPPVPARLHTQPLKTLGLLPSPRWDDGLTASWTPGEHGAETRLRRFLRGRLVDYPAERDLPGRDGTTRLSPHLHFGELSVRRVAAALQRAHMQNPSAAVTRAVDALLRQLLWRDFACYILHHFPQTSDRPFNPRYADFPWKRGGHRLLDAWTRGQTGVPIIDAGMRELWHTGWMHNRVRMLAASFLTKNGMLHWKVGARWFWDTLVDADLAQNSMNWQWVAGCGADAAPYFRIFNPVTQSEKFDPRGAYLRRWLPELARLPDRWIHQPWRAPAESLRDAGVRLDRDYPHPVLDLANTRDQALARFRRR